MLEQNLSGKVAERITQHRNKFRRILTARYLEFLPLLITYKNTGGNLPPVSVDWIRVEKGLRAGNQVVIGEDIQGTIKLIGYIEGLRSTGYEDDFLRPREVLGYKDIRFLIPIEERQTYYQEITDKDNYQTGNFIVLQNKVSNYVSDLEILGYYVDELTEIVVSRYSLAMQAKIMTFFIGDANDEGIEQIVSALYNGSPYIKVNKYFIPEDQIYTLDNGNLAANYVELKREYQNKISELNAMLGINSLAVEKASGVSDVEAKSNRAYTQANANIYLEARNSKLNNLNRRYGLELSAIYNDHVSSELGVMDLLDMGSLGEGGNSEQFNNNAI